MRQFATASTVVPAQYPLFTLKIPVASGDLTQANPSYIMTYDGANNMTQVDMLLDGVTYRKTMTYDGSNNMLTASAWVQV
jgi:hypothetical protein